MRFVALGALMVALAFQPAYGFISVDGTRFVDEAGRQILFHGVSASAKGEDTEEDYARMQEWGFNCVRLGINWDGLEPEPGRFNEAYLVRMDQCIEWAGRHGLYVFIDMHQDLFSAKFIDGAPAWATLDEGKPFLSKGAALSDAYFTSQPVHAAFDNFWANKPGPDGVGLQDHYAALWQRIAARYAESATVLGYDLMNEPFVGSEAAKVLVMLLPKVVEILKGESGGVAGLLDLAAKLTDPSVKSAFLKRLEDVGIYRAVIDTPQALFQAFDRTSLVPFYQRVADAIRNVDQRHILFLETTIASNMGVYSAITPLTGADGKLDRLQAYAPHAYDLVTDTPEVASPCNGRVELILERHGETARRLGIPMLLGEWGAYGLVQGCLPAAGFVTGQIEKLLCSETYWRYNRELPGASSWKAIQRPYPVRVAGQLVEYRADLSTGSLSCSWKEEPGITAPSQVFLPVYFSTPSASPSEILFEVTLSPPGAGYTMRRLRPESVNVIVEIPSSGERVLRCIEARFRDSRH